MNIPIILGTARKGRRSEKVAKFMLRQVLGKKVKSEIIDVRDFVPEATDNTGKTSNAKKFSRKISACDALIVVSPEYNHGYPGELKMVLDLAYSEYHGKPIGFCGVSIGGLGGARVVEQLRLVSVELHMLPTREAIYFSSVAELFDEKGNIKNTDYYKRCDVFLEEIINYAKKLKSKI